MSAHSLPGVVYPHAITPRGHMDMDWTGLWRVDSPHTSLPVDTAHTHIDHGIIRHSGRCVLGDRGLIRCACGVGWGTAICYGGLEHRCGVGTETDVEADSSDEEAGEAAGTAAATDSSDDEVAGNEGGADEYEGGEIDSSDEEDDTAGSVACTIGNAVVPVGYKIIDECPLLTTELQKNEMIGKTVLYGWDSNNATGWFVGTVHSRNLSATDLKKVPTANFVVKYTANMTDGAINGNVACELSARTHGPAEWWLLVEKEAVSATSSAAGKGKGKKGKGK